MAEEQAGIEIVDDAGVTHQFPSGFDPKKAIAIVLGSQGETPKAVSPSEPDTFMGGVKKYLYDKVTKAASVDPLSPAPVMGPGVAAAMSHPLIDAPIVRDFTTPSALLLGVAGSARMPSSGTLRTLGSIAGDVKLHEPLKLVERGLNAIADRKDAKGSPNSTLRLSPAPPAPPERILPGESTPGYPRVGTTPAAAATPTPVDTGSPNSVFRLTPAPAAPVNTAPNTPVTPMSPRVVGKAPTLGGTLESILRDYQQSGEAPQAETLRPTPGSEMTPAVGKHDAIGKKVKVGATSGNPSKTAEQAGETHEPRSVGKDYEHTADVTPTQKAPESQPASPKSEFMEQLQASLESRQGKTTPAEKVPLAEIASKSKREMSPIQGISQADYELLKQVSPGLDPEWIKALNPKLVEELLAFRKQRADSHRINAGLDAGARRATDREP